MDNPYSTPASAVSNVVVQKKWSVSFARFLCYLFLVIWNIAIVVSLLRTVIQVLNNTSSLIGGLLCFIVMSFIFNYPLYSFLKLSGRSPDRRPLSVILFNAVAVIFVVGLFVFTAIVDPNDMHTIYIVCTIIFSFPYLLNLLVTYQLKSYVHVKG